jgi:hypothetical protein
MEMPSCCAYDVMPDSSMAANKGMREDLTSNFFMMCSAFRYENVHWKKPHTGISVSIFVTPKIIIIGCMHK